MDFNWKSITNKNAKDAPDLIATDNNGLLLTADILEEIYTNPDFPKFSKKSQIPNKLEKSMKDSGKSRADLWAFAALVAMRAGLEENNKLCNGPGDLPGRGANPGCGHIYHLEDKCKIDLPNTLGI